ncbi:hypothetical protein [Brevibacterium sp. UCMA 11754]|uniref:hypothetical protein n=1 Tax=Brevibacterium sp. UCMA 11754 TaxID=2749198 RepID=UPI001F2D2251|nr:hypothetical protein [Brevibacterium sp. UCMA 11754]MCF2572544.1 hypothetical protein [Brevibacterium sp. UCMA 11754]
MSTFTFTACRSRVWGDARLISHDIGARQKLKEYSATTPKLDDRRESEQTSAPKYPVT